MTKISNTTFKQQIKTLEKYIKDKMDFDVVYKDVETCECHFTKKLILIDLKLKYEPMLYLMLHEIGHAKLYMKNKRYDKKYNEIYENFSKGSFTYKTTILQEELDAWQEAIILSKKLDFKINKKSFEVEKTKCIMSYINWISNAHKKAKERKTHE
jgi:hypothetical protein